MKPSREQLLAKVICPECKQGKLKAVAASTWRCENCGAEFPLVDHDTPALYQLKDLPGFVEHNRKYQAAKKRGASQKSGPVYHWKVYGFGALLPRPTATSELLVVGCGSGKDRPVLEQLGFQVTNLDVRATEETDLLADAHNLPFPDASFDVVLSSQVLEHLVRPWRAVEEIQRILKPGGVFVGSVAYMKPYHGSFFHISHEGMQALFEQAGMQMDHAHGAQSTTWSMFAEMLPFRFPVSARPTIRSISEKMENVYWRFDSALYRWRTRKNPNKASGEGLKLSYAQLRRLRFAPAVVFRARKPE